MKKYNHFTLNEREQLYDLLQKGIKKKEISKILDKDRTSIYRELKRNSTSIEAKYNNSPKKIKYYLPYKADHKYRLKRKRSKYSFPLNKPETYKYVIEKLTSFEAWSPDSISGRIEEDIGGKISHECIYQFIYSKRAKALELWKYLRRAHKKRRKQKGRKSRRELIPGRKDISLRPVKVEQRKRYGDWEGDSVLGIGKKSALHTELERISRMLFIEKIKRKTAEEAKKAMIRIYKPLPKKLKRTTTLDNGPEHVRHEDVTNKTGIQIYFARPYASWQRGANENANGLVRWYYPKGTNFDEVSKAELKRVQDAINNRPRKSLGYKKPIEIFNSILSSLNQNVALEI
jgi:IS30 family transposase